MVSLDFDIFRGVSPTSGVRENWIKIRKMFTNINFYFSKQKKKPFNCSIFLEILILSTYYPPPLTFSHHTCFEK